MQNKKEASKDFSYCGFLPKDRRGQGLSTNAIVLIILAVVVLAILIIGFTIGWDKIAPWIKPSNNIKDLSQQCQVACGTGDSYGFCNLARELKIEEGMGDFKSGEKYTCFELSKVPSFGISGCSTITCEESEENIEEESSEEN